MVQLKINENEIACKYLYSENKLNLISCPVGKVFSIQFLEEFKCNVLFVLINLQ